MKRSSIILRLRLVVSGMAPVRELIAHVAQAGPGTGRQEFFRVRGAIKGVVRWSGRSKATIYRHLAWIAEDSDAPNET
ncbi:hypothetical protein [Noviherbaspirillum sp.]|uniref:hypothetical protein n=1 Tax=Noviherbaspirillum sp. TaxID=1926288 RepID=UPI002B483A2F|nr:hypothetical protein [Noviherbaspirillum sp.]HJV79366.1 hypothetical protein [Noviherbaspirillum sp.]